MYTYRKKRIVRNVLLVVSILAVTAFIVPSILANIPSTHEIIGSIENEISKSQGQYNNSPITNQQVNVDASPDKPCVLDTSHPSLGGGTPLNPPCVIQDGSTKSYCSKDSSGIICSVTPPQQSVQTDDSKSPYGPKQTQYYMDQLRQQPQFMDCTDQQLIHYFNLESQFNHLSYVNSPFGNWANNPDAQRYVGDNWNNPNPLSSQETQWVLEKQSEYASLLSKIQNYGC